MHGPADDAAVSQRRPAAVDDRGPQVGRGGIPIAQRALATVERDEGVLDDVLGGSDVVDEQRPQADQGCPLLGIQPVEVER